MIIIKNIFLATLVASTFSYSVITLAEPQGCGVGSTKTGQIYKVNGSEIMLMSAPNGKGKKLINEKATAALGSTQYLTIDNTVTVKEECSESGWSKVGITEPDFLANTHKGWVKSTALRGQVVKKNGQIEYVEADFYFDKRSKPYKKLIIEGVNKLHRENSQCKTLDPGSVGLSSKGTKANPVFYVTCGTGSNVFNAFFSKNDLSKNSNMAAAPHINQTQAIRECEAYAKANSTHPSTVNFSKFVDLAIHEFPNGRTSVLSSFTAKNSFNLELKYNIRCLSDAKGFFEASISEAAN